MNTLSLQRGRGICLGSKEVKHPTISEIEEMNSDTYYQLLFSIILNPKDVADILWCESKIWYEDIKNDWLFFIERIISSSETLIVDSELDGLEEESEFIKVPETIKNALNYFLNLKGEYVLVQKYIGDSEETQIILCNVQMNDKNKYILKEDNFKFTEVYYNQLVPFLKRINWMNSVYKFDKGGTKFAKKYILEHLYKERNKKKEDNIDISTINSALIAKGIQNSWDMPIYTFFECYYRLVKIDEYQNTMSALYAGGIDTKKNPIDWEKINWASVINI